MKTGVHILVTVRNPELLPAALLVFQTIRKGFPTASIFARGNDLAPAAAAAVEAACAKVHGRLYNGPATTHGQWIENLVMTEPNPLWICDTDVVFFGKLEHWTAALPFAGRLEPEFREPWTKTRHVERLHPSLMWFDPAALRLKLRTWPGVHGFFGTVRRDLFEWSFVPSTAQRGEVLFYDTCAGLHHAIVGEEFPETVSANYEHLFCGTYSDLIGRSLGMTDLPAVHKGVCANPEACRGLRMGQAAFYERNAIAESDK